MSELTPLERLVNTGSEEIPSSKSTRGKRKPKEQSLESPAIFGTPNASEGGCQTHRRFIV